MLELNHSLLKPPQLLRRLAALADVDTKQLMRLTGLSESAVNNYLSDDCTRQNYLFQFALEFLAEEKLHNISSQIYFTPSPHTFKRLEKENDLMYTLLLRFVDMPCDTPTKEALIHLLSALETRYGNRSQSDEDNSNS